MPITAESAPSLRVDGDTLVVTGDLGFATVGGVLEAGREAIAGARSSSLVLDLGAVEKADSAGVALLLDWVRAARARNLELTVCGVPGQLAEIARLGGLESIIGITERADAT